jgi:hypothetical protein
MKRFVTRALIVVAATLAIAFAQVAPASATASKKLESNLAALWTAVLETPASQNPVAGNGSPCWDLGHRTVAPFFGGSEFSCTVKTGTKLFVVGFSTECSTIPGDDGGTEFTEEQLRACAREADADKAPRVTLDGRSVPLTDVETPALKIVLPADNILGAPAGTYSSVAHGLVALLHPLTPGTHTIVISGNFPENTTTIVVKPGH